MPKNIVVCCDGTANEYGDANTNILKLYSILPSNDEKQITFYDPGVGTLSMPGVFTKPVKWSSPRFLDNEFSQFHLL
jgi:uncharacterized protein (DUF2235 family)